ncbi:Scr1 family TA system antitoxin-like transcriptional regulator, partial [Streptomyces halstedii]|uniref:Scr1 family TA system antitoxin-like transcriptional regulator n=1 Tax=Streptomyces halstedii TaxID=1944 RepID=UPI0037F4E33D
YEGDPPPCDRTHRTPRAPPSGRTALLSKHALGAAPSSLAGARRQLRHLAALSERPNTSRMRTSLRLAIHRI